MRSSAQDRVMQVVRHMPAISPPKNGIYLNSCYLSYYPKSDRVRPTGQNERLSTKSFINSKMAVTGMIYRETFLLSYSGHHFLFLQPCTCTDCSQSEQTYCRSWFRNRFCFVHNVYISIQRVFSVEYVI